MNMLRDDHHHVGDSFEVNHKHGVPIKYCPGAPQKKKMKKKFQKTRKNKIFLNPETLIINTMVYRPYLPSHLISPFFFLAFRS